MTDIIMPRLSDSMEEGTILKWLKGPGDEVRVGEPLAEIETDKATMTYEADAAGFLDPVAAEGDTLPIGALIGRVHASASAAAESASTESATAAAAPAAAAETETAAEPAAAAAAEAQTAAEPASATARAGNGATATAVAEPVVEVAAVSRAVHDVEAAPPGAAPGPRAKASPVARRIARELGVDLAGLAGSGPDGRIVKADVVAASAPASSPATAAPVPAAADATGAKGAVGVVEPNRTQQVIARRMASAKATIPEFQVTVDVDAEAAFELREQLRGQAEPLPSINDLVIKACALALRAHPRVNGAYVDGHFEYYGRVNIGMAVASEGSLVVPTIFDADLQSLTAIAAATRSLAARVRDQTITPPELAGGTFTVSNLGMFGVSRFTAVINPPQAAILAVGAALPRAIVGDDGTVSARRVMELTLSADHRIVYGADAADFLTTVRKRLERPAGLLL